MDIDVGGELRLRVARSMRTYLWQSNSGVGWLVDFFVLSINRKKSTVRSRDREMMMLFHRGYVLLVVVLSSVVGTLFDVCVHLDDEGSWKGYL